MSLYNPEASFPESVWDGTSRNRPDLNTQSRPSWEDWARVTSEVNALQYHLSVKNIPVPAASFMTSGAEIDWTLGNNRLELVGNAIAITLGSVSFATPSLTVRWDNFDLNKYFVKYPTEQYRLFYILIGTEYLGENQYTTIAYDFKNKKLTLTAFDIQVWDFSPLVARTNLLPF